MDTTSVVGCSSTNSGCSQSLIVGTSKYILTEREKAKSVSMLYLALNSSIVLKLCKRIYSGKPMLYSLEENTI